MEEITKEDLVKDRRVHPYIHDSTTHRLKDKITKKRRIFRIRKTEINEVVLASLTRYDVYERIRWYQWIPEFLNKYFGTNFTTYYYVKPKELWQH